MLTPELVTEIIGLAAIVLAITQASGRSLPSMMSLIPKETPKILPAC